jgi:hypothetical protein
MLMQASKPAVKQTDLGLLILPYNFRLQGITTQDVINPIDIRKSMD